MSPTASYISICRYYLTVRRAGQVLRAYGAGIVHTCTELRDSAPKKPGRRTGAAPVSFEAPQTEEMTFEAPHIDGTEPTCRRRGHRQKDQAGELFQAAGQLPAALLFCQCPVDTASPLICAAHFEPRRAKKHRGQKGQVFPSYSLYTYIYPFFLIFFII